MSASPGGKVGGAAYDPRSQPTRRGNDPLVLGAALVEVFVQQVQASGVAEGFDLVEQVKDRNLRLLGAPLPQMVAVGVDQASPVIQWTAQLVRLGRSGVAFDGIQRQAETPCAVQQADTLIEQIVDRMPAFQRSGLAGECLPFRAGSGPASAMRGNDLPHRSGQAVPTVPAVTDLQRSARRIASA